MEISLIMKITHSKFVSFLRYFPWFKKEEESLFNNARLVISSIFIARKDESLNDCNFHYIKIGFPNISKNKLRRYLLKDMRNCCGWWEWKNLNVESFKNKYCCNQSRYFGKAIVPKFLRKKIITKKHLRF